MLLGLGCNAKNQIDEWYNTMNEFLLVFALLTVGNQTHEVEIGSFGEFECGLAKSFMEERKMMVDGRPVTFELKCIEKDIQIKSVDTVNE
jgi:hypothetical protein